MYIIAVLEECAPDARSLAVGGDKYLPPLPWTYYAPPTVSSLQPADGPALSDSSCGHTDVQLADGTYLDAMN